jgi:hypothetical protein
MKPTSNAAYATGETSIEELAARGGISAEHVVLDGGGDGAPEEERSTVVRQSIKLKNPVRRTRIELRIFKDGFMSVLEQKGKRRRPERVIDLKYLDAAPKLSRYIAMKTAKLAGILAVSSVIWSVVAVLGLWPAVTGMLGCVSLIATGATIRRYALKTRDTIEFQTRTGRATVLSLVANIGSQQAYRAAVPTIVAAIRHANGKLDGDAGTRLRDEVREHYRLARTGVIEKSACAQATRSILSDF